MSTHYYTWPVPILFNVIYSCSLRKPSTTLADTSTIAQTIVDCAIEGMPSIIGSWKR